MDSNIDWIYDLEDEFKNQTNKEVINISDWNNEDQCIEIPREILLNSSNIDLFNFSKYYYIESLEKSRAILKQYIFTTYNINIDDRDILFVNNSTYAIFLVCKVLKELKQKRALLITPAYFSIEHNLKDFNFSIIYYHLTTSNDFIIDLESISKIIDEQFIDVVFITNPIFCTGLEIETTIFEELFKLFIEKQIWVVIDNTLDQLFWNKQNDLFNTFFLNKCNFYDKLIYIDSSTKKLFINGLKHSVIISKLPSLTSIEYDSDYNIGSLAVNQVRLINEIYNEKNSHIIENSINKNITLFQNNYLLSQNLLIDSEYYLTNSICGFYTCIIHKKKKFYEIDSKDFIKRLLFKDGILLFSLEHFLFHHSNNFGFRLNLSKHPYKISKSLKSLIEINL